MGRTSKLPRYEEFNEAVNAFGERANDPRLIGEYLDLSQPLTLELGCGKAEVTLGLAEKYPNENFMGIDLKADRLWRASKDALQSKLVNVAFWQANILEVGNYLPEHSVDRIWITFPDPFPKTRHAKHRMLNRNFLDVYKQLLTTDGTVHFKTDNLALFAWAYDLLSNQPDVSIGVLEFDLHASDQPEDTKIKTSYEQRFIHEGLRINYLQFQFLQNDAR